MARRDKLDTIDFIAARAQQRQDPLRIEEGLFEAQVEARLHGARPGRWISLVCEHKKTSRIDPGGPWTKGVRDATSGDLPGE